MRAADHGARGGSSAHDFADFARRGFASLAPAWRGQRAVETALVPEIRLSTAQTGMARLDRKAGAAVPFDRRAGVIGGRALASEFVQAPAIARALVIEGFCELALVVERAAVAAVVNRVAEKRQRSAMFIEIGYPPVDTNCNQRAVMTSGIGGQPETLMIGLSPIRSETGRAPVGLGSANGMPPNERAGADADDGRGALGCLGQDVDSAAARSAAVDASLAQSVPNRRRRRYICRSCPSSPASRAASAWPRCGCHQSVVVVQRDDVENQILRSSARMSE